MFIFYLLVISILSAVIVKVLFGTNVVFEIIKFFNLYFFVNVLLRSIHRMLPPRQIVKMYIFEWNREYLCYTILICCAIFFGLLIMQFIFLSNKFKNVLKNKKEKILFLKKYWIYIILVSISFFILSGVLWAYNMFPINRPDAVLATIMMPHSSIDEDIIVSCVIDVFLTSILLTIDIMIVSFFQSKKLSSWIIRGQYVFIMICCMVVCISRIPLGKYIQIIQNGVKKPEYSDFYEKYYVNPTEVNIVFPDRKKNLIVILIESGENSFSSYNDGGLSNINYIPNITQLCREEVSFGKGVVGGGRILDGTGWTIASFVSKFNGIPLALTHGGSDGAQNMKKFLPNNTGLTDILASNGYSLVFSFGSSDDFASRGVFLKDHGNVDVHDLDYFKSINKLPKNYKTYWGFEDNKLYSFAKDEITQLANMDIPFFYGMLTVDTHLPGFVCESCDEGIDDRYHRVVSCADRQLGEFVEWAKKQEWYENTTIAIMGDHILSEGYALELFGENFTDDKRRWLDVFINSSYKGEIMQDREFSSFDMFPTLLSSIGVYIEGNSLGFGRSLYSDRKTIVEEIGNIDYINQELLRPNLEYFFWESRK